MFKLVDIITKGLDSASLRHKVLSNNLANANTPQFRRSDVDFSAVFLGSGKLPLKSTHNKHVTNSIRSRYSRSVVVQDKSTSMRNDGNNVDIDREMVLVLENQMHYQAMTDTVNRNLSLLRSVIGEGR